MSDLDREIRERAYLLWERAGRPPGSGEEFWFLAQQELYGGAPPSDGPEAEAPPTLADTDDD